MESKRELQWRAVYEDKSILNQYEPSGKENKYTDIDRERLVRFDMLDKATQKPVYSVWLNEGQQLIYRRRTIMPIKPTPERPIQVIYLVGYRQTIMTNSGPRNFVVLNYLYEDGSVALDNERDNLQLYPIEM